MHIEDGRFRTSRSRDDTPQDAIKALRSEIFKGIGDTQLPDVMLEVDAHTRFSWSLLNRPPHNERELLTLYAALLAHGTDLNARQVVRMVGGVREDRVRVTTASFALRSNPWSSNKRMVTRTLSSRTPPIIRTTSRAFRSVP